jgi:predicted alpha/beta-hydrolase family hydrolase
VQRAEDEVTCLGGGHRRRDRLEVAHLADEDHVRVLAKRTAQAFGKRRRVDADLALVDDAALVAMQELDRILDGEDVVVPRPVDLVDHRGERGRLA